MKRTFFFFAAFFLFSFAASAQVTATKDASGNYIQAPTKPKTAVELTEGATDTGKTFTDKDGNKFPVYTTKNGKTFYVAISKTSGKPYRRYFKVSE